jgi:hypothetical protein
MAFYAEATEIIVQVYDTQGNPVDGVAVAFKVDPKWATEATVAPSRTVTHKGVARTVFQADVIGTVGITAQVEQMTQTARISVRVRGTPRGS